MTRHDLNELVATKVMGWHRRKDFWATAEEWDTKVAPGNWSPMDSIDAAWGVVEKIGKRFVLRHPSHANLWQAGFECDSGIADVGWHFVKNNCCVFAGADTAPMAICLAALKAVGVEVPHE